MPGFVICGQGDSGLSAKIEIRRKHRWVWQTLTQGSSEAGAAQFTQAELLVLAKAQRPQVKFDAVEMHHDQERAYFAGKTEWNPIKLVWYDVEQEPNVSQSIWNWFNRVTSFTRGCIYPPSYYKGEGVLSMTGGCTSGLNNGSVGGAEISESWMVCNAWPQDGNWGDLDYAESALATIEVVMKFDRAMKTI